MTDFRLSPFTVRPSPNAFYRSPFTVRPPLSAIRRDCVGAVCFSLRVRNVWLFCFRRTREWQDEQTDSRKGELNGGQTDESTKGWIDRRSDGRTDLNPNHHRLENKRLPWRPPLKNYQFAYPTPPNSTLWYSKMFQGIRNNFVHFDNVYFFRLKLHT